jgi:hypothetical protein
MTTTVSIDALSIKAPSKNWQASFRGSAMSGQVAGTVIRMDRKTRIAITVDFDHPAGLKSRLFGMSY